MIIIIFQFGENSWERMNKYAKLDTNPEYSYMSDYIKHELDNVLNMQVNLPEYKLMCANGQRSPFNQLL